jgi:hypothetical protein
MPGTPQPISQLPAAGSAGTSDILPIVQSGTTKKATIAQILANVPVVSGGGAAESQAIGAAIEKKGTALLVAADGSAPTVVPFGAVFPTAIDNIQLTIRSTTSATLKILCPRPDGAAPTTAAISIQVFGGDAASTASVDWLVKGH